MSNFHPEGWRLYSQYRNVRIAEMQKDVVDLKGEHAVALEADHDLTPFEVAMLREASNSQDLGVAYGLTRDVDPGIRPADQHELVSRTLRKLVQLGFVAFFMAPLDDGYSVELSDATLLSPEEVEGELALGSDHVYPESAMLFFLATPLGRERLRAVGPRGLVGE